MWFHFDNSSHSFPCMEIGPVQVIVVTFFSSYNVVVVVFNTYTCRGNSNIFRFEGDSFSRRFSWIYFGISSNLYILHEPGRISNL